MVQENSDFPASLNIVGRKQEEYGRTFDLEAWLVMAEKIRQNAEQGRNIIIHGPSRTGKTEMGKYLEGKNQFSVKFIDYQLERGDEKKPPSIAKLCGGIINLVFEEDGLSQNLEGVVHAAKKWASQARQEGKIPVVFFDEWQGSARTGEEELKNFYLELTQKLFVSKGLVSVHSFVSPVDGEKAVSCFPSLFGFDAVVFETESLIKSF